MGIKRIDPRYSSLSQTDIDKLAEFVERVGFSPILAGLGDILTQDQRYGPGPEFALVLGIAIARGLDVDRHLKEAAATAAASHT